MIKLNSIIKICCGITLLITLFSCSDESNGNNYPAYDGEKYAMNVSLKAPGTTIGDETISKVRFIVFTDDNKLVSNQVQTIETASALTGLQTLAARGRNDFYVICNETPELTEKLAAVRQPEQIEKINFNASGITPPLPMYGKVLHTTVSADDEGKNAKVTINGVVYNSLSVDLTRMMSKLNLTVIKNMPESNDFVVEKIKVKISRMPKYNSIAEGIPYTETEWSDDLTFEGEGTLDNNGEYVTSDDNYTVPENIDRIIFPDTYIPEHIHSDKTDDSRSTYLTIEATCRSKMNSSVVNSVYQLDLGKEPPVDFDLTRNVNYKIYATITGTGALGLHAVIVPMDEKNIIVNWSPKDGLIIVSDKIADYGYNINPWSDYYSYSGILKIVQGGVYKDALFKYGSIIAIYGNGGNTNFASTDILWKPETFTTSISSWSDIPSMTSGDIPLPNTAANVNAGLGDPCRLVGLSPEQIRTGVVDNGTWRMATETEYQYLINANTGTDSRGYTAYQYLLLPNMLYRNESGQLSTDNTSGNYWNSSAPKTFDFGSTGGSFSTRNVAHACAIRCVRNTTSASKMTTLAENLTYAGGKSKISVLFVNNVPYWKAQLTTGDQSAFSFSGNKTEGNFDGELYADIQPLTDPYTPRSFTVTLKGYGLDGVVHDNKLTITQSRKDHVLLFTSISPEPPIDGGYGWIPAEGATYSVTAELNNNPPDMATDYPDAEWYVSMSVIVGTERNVVGTTVKYGQPSVIKIPANDAGEIRTVILKVRIKDSSKYPPTRYNEAERQYIQKK